MAKAKSKFTCCKDAVGDDAYEVFTKADLGDIVGVVGTVMVTNTGELSVKAEQFVHLTKALRPLLINIMD